MSTINLVINNILEIMKISEKMGKIVKTEKVINLMSAINPDKIRISEFSERHNKNRLSENSLFKN